MKRNFAEWRWRSNRLSFVPTHAHLAAAASRSSSGRLLASPATSLPNVWQRFTNAFRIFSSIRSASWQREGGRGDHSTCTGQRHGAGVNVHALCPRAAAAALS